MNSNVSNVKSQSQLIREYNDATKPHFNPVLFERRNEDIVEEMQKLLLSCERDRYFTLKVLSFRTIENYEEIRETLRKHEEERNNKKKDKKFDNIYDYIDINDSDIILLEVTYLIRINNGKNDPKDTDTLVVYIALPRFVDKYYFKLSGKYYAPIFQVIENVYNNSTTNSSTPTITLRTELMSVKIFRFLYDLVDFNTGEQVQATYYISNIFNKSLPAIRYLLARYGFYGAMEFLDLGHIYVTDFPNDALEDNYCFEKNGIYVTVPKFLFNGEPMIQSMAVTVLEAIDKKTKYDEMMDPRFWVRALGSSFKSPTLEKGLPVLDSLESIYDIKSRESLRLPDEDKSDIYRLLRWALREFMSLKLRDTLDLSFKRIRMAECIPALYALKLSKSIYRISDEGKKIKLEQVKRAIYTQPMYVISVLNSSKLVPFVDMVNDNDATTALSYTYKGIGGLGDQGSVQKVYKAVHPSHLARLDLDSSSASDPGMSGLLCPMVELSGDSFSDYQEPNGWRENFDSMLKEYRQLVGKKEVLSFQKKCGFEKYDAIKDDLVKETLDMYRKLICPIIDLDGKIDYALNSSIETNNNPADTGNTIVLLEPAIPTFTTIETQDDYLNAPGMVTFTIAEG